MTQPTAQSGAATLAITLLLSMVMLMVLTFANRNVIFELRSAANQVRAAQAFEVAEAGLAWAQAQLNNPTPLDDECHSTESPPASTHSLSFRERMLSSLGTPTGLPVTCRQTPKGWACQCPNQNSPSADPANASPEPESTAPAFTVQVLAGARADLLTVVATGCSESSDCRAQINAPASPASAAPEATLDATPSAPSARLQTTLGALPVLSAPPDAALMARGTVQLEGQWNIEQLEPSPSGSSWALRIGGALQAPALQANGPPGSPASHAVLAHDEPLRSLTAQSLFVRLFRLDPAAWQAQPMVHRLPCPEACDAALARLLQRETAHAPVWLPNGLRLNTAITLGSPEHPVLLVIDGPVQLAASVRLYGVLYARSPEWSDTAGSTLLGALIAESDLHGTGRTRLQYHPGVLQRLQQQPGLLARVAGSWRDF